MSSHYFKLVLSLFLIGFLPFCAKAQYDKIVAADGSGDYTTISAALLAAPFNPTIPFKIFIKNGIYKEKVTINRTFITLVGESAANVIIRWDDYYLKVPNLQPKSTATVTINANDVVMMNITVENRSADTMDGPQALALNVNRDRCAFKNCRFIGGQDTISTDRNGTRQYFKDCYIDGNTDFIYGGSTTLFDNCIIYGRDRIDRGSGGYLTAANTPVGQTYGYVFRNCVIPDNNGYTSYVLGRPWGNDSGTATANKANNKTVFINTTMGQSINSVGWSVWDSGTITNLISYAEYNSLSIAGQPVDINGRVSWSQQLTSTDAANYTTANILTNTSGAWDPCAISGMCTTTATEIAVSNFRLRKESSLSKLSCNLNWPIDQVKAELFRSDDNINFVKIAESYLSLSNYNFNFSDNLPQAGQSYYYKILASKVGLNTFSTEVIKLDGPSTLPLNLVSFKALVENRPSPSVKLIWKTIGEKNTQSTIIERSDNGKEFNQIGIINAINKSTETDYSFYDTKANFENRYYRLKFLDFDGSFTYSDIVSISMGGGSTLTVYPNPAKGVVVVNHPKALLNSFIRISKISGQTIFKEKVICASISTTIDLIALPRGLYLLSFENNNDRKSVSILIE